jgi:hypothetical protein
MAQIHLLYYAVILTKPAIYGLYLDSPKSSARTEWYGNGKDADPALLPRLRSFSDIMWAYWVRDNPNIKNIRYFFMLGISNDQTNKLIASVLQKTGKTLSEWPGVSVEMDTDEGKALLGMISNLTLNFPLLLTCDTRRNTEIIKVLQTAPHSPTSSSNTNPNSAAKPSAKSPLSDLKTRTIMISLMPV